MERKNQQSYKPRSAGSSEVGQTGTGSYFPKKNLSAGYQSQLQLTTPKFAPTHQQPMTAVIISAGKCSHAIQELRCVYEVGADPLAPPRGLHAPLGISNGVIHAATSHSYGHQAECVSVNWRASTAHRAFNSLNNCAPFCAVERLANSPDMRRVKCLRLISIFFGCLLTLGSAWAPRLLLGTPKEIRLSGDAEGQVHQDMPHYSSSEKTSPTKAKNRITEDELQQAGAAHQLAEQVIQNLESRGISLQDSKIYGVLRSTVPQLQFLGIDAGAFEEAFRQIVASRSTPPPQRSLDVEQVNRKLIELAERLEELQAGQRNGAGNNRSTFDIPNVPRSGVSTNSMPQPKHTDQQFRTTPPASKQLDEGHAKLGAKTLSQALEGIERTRFVKVLPARGLGTEVEQGNLDGEGLRGYWEDTDKTDEEDFEEDQFRGRRGIYQHGQNYSRRQKAFQQTLSNTRNGKIQSNNGSAFPLFRHEDAFAADGIRHHSFDEDLSGDSAELQGQQISLMLRKSVAGSSGTLDKGIEFTLDHHRPSGPQCANNNGRPPAYLDVPLVAASFDAPGASAIAILGRFRNDAKLLLDVFAESVIDSLSPQLRRRWKITPEEIELYSIKDCDLTIYLHCNYIEGRPDPNLGTPLVCSCANAAASANTSHATMLNKNSYVRIEWNLLDLSRRGRKGTTDLVKAVNADLQRKGKCNFMTTTTFGRTLSTVVGYPVRTAMAYYSFSGAFRPGCRKPGMKRPVPSFPHVPSLPPPAPDPPEPDATHPGKPHIPQPRPPFEPPTVPNPPGPDATHPGKPNIPQPRPPFKPPPNKPAPPSRPPLVPPKPPSPFDCVFVGVDFFGFDVAKDETGEVQSASECAERCKFELTCFYWTFNQRRHWCYLKNALAPLGKYQDPVTTRSLVSGVKGCNALPDAYPSEPCYVRNINIVTDPKGYNRSVQHCRTALDCHAACVTDPACFYWVFDEIRRACTVKGRKLLEPTRLDHVRDTTGLISGAKRCPIERAIGRPRRLMEEDSESSKPPAVRNLEAVDERQEDACSFTEGDLSLAAHDVLEGTRAKHPTECRTRCVTHAVNTFNSRLRNPFSHAKDRDKQGSANKMLEECVFWRFDWNNGKCTLFGRDAWRGWKSPGSGQAVVGTHRCRQFSSLYPPLSALDLCYQEYITIIPESSDLRLSVVPEVTDPGQCDLLCASQSKCVSWTLQKGKKAKNSTCTLFQGNAHKRKMVSPGYQLQQSYPHALSNSRHRSSKVTVVSALLGARPCSQESVSVLLSSASSRRTAELPVSSAPSQVDTDQISTKRSGVAVPWTVDQATGSGSAQISSDSNSGMHGGILKRATDAESDASHRSSEEKPAAPSPLPGNPQTASSASADTFSASLLWAAGPQEAHRTELYRSPPVQASPAVSSTPQQWQQEQQRRAHASPHYSSETRLPPCSQVGVEFVGHDLLPRTLMPTAASAVKCLTLCAGAKFCFFWTYDAQSRLCYLKDVNAPSIAVHGKPTTLISGSKYCPPLSTFQSWAYSATGYSPVPDPAATAGTRDHLTQFTNEHPEERDNGRKDLLPAATEPSSAHETPTPEDSSLLWSALSGRAWNTPALFASWLPNFDGSRAPPLHGGGGFLAKNRPATEASGVHREAVGQQVEASNQQGLHRELPYEYGHLQRTSHMHLQQEDDFVRHPQGPESQLQATLQENSRSSASPEDDERKRLTYLQEGTSDPTKPQSIKSDDATPRTPDNVSSLFAVAFQPSAATATTDDAELSGLLHKENQAGRVVNSTARKSPTLKCKQEGVALLGGDLIILGPIDGKNGSGAVETPAQCALLCIHNAGCSYWTLDMENHTCYLKAPSALRYYTKNESTKNFISGPAINTKDCPLNLMF